MKKPTNLADLVGLEHTKLGFFKEVQVKIEELRRSNTELERKRREIQAILDGITDVMAVVSLDYRIVSVNQVFFKSFPHADPTGAFCYHVFRGSDRPCSPCPLLTARRTNRVCRQTLIFPVEEQNRQFEVTASPLRDAKGNPSSILIVKRDVTLEMQYQAKYYHAEKMATIGLLAAGVAHEINNPLTAVSGFAEGLRRRMSKLDQCLDDSPAASELREDFREYVETILEECNRCRDIVGSLLTFSPRQRAEFAPVDLNRMVADVLRLLQHQLKRKPEDLIRLELEPSLPLARGVGAELKQVVLNLVLNALDAVAEGGDIAIRTRVEDEKWLLLSVSDTGEGIEPEHLGKLFEPFFTTKPVGRGIGIGLSTCYNIIRQHDGDIDVTSEVGKGSRFTVKLPLKSERIEEHATL